MLHFALYLLAVSIKSGSIPHSDLCTDQFQICHLIAMTLKASLLCGEVSEWLKEHAWKACIGETLSRVRIPLSPPY